MPISCSTLRWAARHSEQAIGVSQSDGWFSAYPSISLPSVSPSHRFALREEAPTPLQRLCCSNDSSGSFGTKVFHRRSARTHPEVGSPADHEQAPAVNAGLIFRLLSGAISWLSHRPTGRAPPRTPAARREPIGTSTIRKVGSRRRASDTPSVKSLEGRSALPEHVGGHCKDQDSENRREASLRTGEALS